MDFDILPNAHLSLIFTDGEKVRNLA